MWHIFILAGLIVCAIQTIRSERLLVSALWLAGTSAMTSILLYLIGGYQIAVIELSVGAGLVTILFVFAINIAGEEPLPILTIIPKPLAWLSVIVAVGLIGWQLTQLTIFQNQIGLTVKSDFAQVLWVDRKLDLDLQIVFIFAGVLSMVGLLGDKNTKKVISMEDKIS